MNWNISYYNPYYLAYSSRTDDSPTAPTLEPGPGPKPEDSTSNGTSCEDTGASGKGNNIGVGQRGDSGNSPTESKNETNKSE